MNWANRKTALLVLWFGQHSATYRLGISQFMSGRPWAGLSSVDVPPSLDVPKEAAVDVLPESMCS